MRDIAVIAQLNRIVDNAMIAINCSCDLYNLFFYARLKKKIKVFIIYLYYMYIRAISGNLYNKYIASIYIYNFSQTYLSLSLSLFLLFLSLCNMQYVYRAGDNEHVCGRNCKSAVSA